MSQQVATELPRYQCVLCDFKIRELPAKGNDGVPHCPRCGAPNIRDVEATDGVYDNAPLKAVEHFFREVKKCWNGNVNEHDLVIETVPVVNLATSEYHDVQRCKTCKLAYTKLNGRMATGDEIVQARARKLPSPSSMMWAGKGDSA